MYIDINNYEKAFPNDLMNFELLKEKKLGDEVPNEKYFSLVNKYRKYFELYLKEILPIEKLDNNLKESELNFVPIKDEDKDFYQLTSTMGLTYIYLRNNLYIERLDIKDIELLENLDEYNEETKEFVKRTFKNVINPYNDSRIIFYGPENQKFLCYSDEVVLGIRYDEFNTELDEEEFKQNFIEKQDKISDMIVVMAMFGLKELGVNLNLIQYNELSIIRKYSENAYEK